MILYKSQINSKTQQNKFMKSPDADQEVSIVRNGIPYAFVLNECGFALRRTDGEMITEEKFEELLTYIQAEGWGISMPERLEEKKLKPCTEHPDSSGFPAMRLPPPLVKKTSMPRRVGFLHSILARLLGRGNCVLFPFVIATVLSTASGSCRQACIPAESRTTQSILQWEVDSETHSLHPKRMIIVLSDLRTGAIEAAASKNGKMLSTGAALREASSFRFHPGAVFDLFTIRELRKAGIPDQGKVTTLDLVRLFGAVANGGILKPEGRRIIEEEDVEPRRSSLLDLVQGKNNPILLARVEGIRVAGAAGHGGTNPVTACFAGYFPADHPRHTCVVVIEGADVILRYQKGGLLAAPIFSFASVKVHRLDLQP